MSYFPTQHYKRRGAKQSSCCDLCGAWVDTQDLILADVQGLRGYYVCSSHKWEKDVRTKPSFQDRGGVGQVMDPGHDFLPAPGGENLMNSYLFSMFALSSVAVGSSYAVDGALFVNPAASPFTLEAVVYFASAPVVAQVVASTYDFSPPGFHSHGWYVYIDTDRTVGLVGTTTAATTSKLSPHKAHRISVVRSGSAAAIYFDGVAQNMASTDPGIDSGLFSESFYLGAGPQLATLTSPDAIGDIRVFDHARTAEEIAAFWNVPLPVGTTGLMAYWPTTEGLGTVLNDTAGVIDADMTIVDGDGWTSHSLPTNLP